MTQEEKQLLLIDLCARLPYGVRVKELGSIKELELYLTSIYHDTVQVETTTGGKMACSIEAIKPYLRPLSSMTTEEEYEYHQCKNINYLDICEMEHVEMLETTALCFSRATDWLNKKGFDYRGLIPMGLALEAPEGMYKE